MSEPAKSAIQFTITVSLPESATDEQREIFRRSLELQMISPSVTITVSLPESATDEQREIFRRSLEEQGNLLVRAVAAELKALPDGPSDPKELETKPV